MFFLGDENSARNARYMCCYLGHRKKIFVDSYGWEVPSTDRTEFDEYDLPFARYLVLSKDGEFRAGARLIRCDNCHRIRDTEVSYMIRDASLGRLNGLQSNLLDIDAPTDPETWELSRVVASETKAGFAIISACHDWLASQGARSTLFIGSPVFMRFGRRVGVVSERLGPDFTEGDNRPFCVMRAQITASQIRVVV